MDGKNETSLLTEKVHLISRKAVKIAIVHGDGISTINEINERKDLGKQVKLELKRTDEYAVAASKEARGELSD